MRRTSSKPFENPNVEADLSLPELPTETPDNFEIEDMKIELMSLDPQDEVHLTAGELLTILRAIG